MSTQSVFNFNSKFLSASALPVPHARKSKLLIRRAEIGAPEHDASVLIETPAILIDILAMMRHLDAGHCEAMVELIAAHDEVGKGVGA